MLTGRNARRRARTTPLTPGALALALVCALAAVALPTRGQDVEPDLPDAAGVVGAWFTVSDWVRSFSPPPLDDKAAQVPVGGATGVCVVLRHKGRVVGVGADHGGGDLMVRRAAGRALSAALGDTVIAALPEDKRAHAGRMLTAELEVAGRLVPVPGRSFARVAEQLEPGLDGLAMRRGDDVRMSFPSRLRAEATAEHAERELVALAVELGMPARALDELHRRFGARVYRFRTTHLAQRDPTKGPFETCRGQDVVPLASVSPASIRALGEGIVDFLVTTLWDGDERPLGLQGDYRGVLDVYEPPVAPPRDQALAAFALGRWAEVRAAAADADAADAERARNAAVTILRFLREVDEIELDPLHDAESCAAIVYAVSTIGGERVNPEIDLLFESAAARVRQASAEGGDPMPAHARALVAGALARLLRLEPDRLDADAVRRVIDRAWRDTMPQERINLLPWIGWAELDWAQATGHPPAHMEALKELRFVLASSRDVPDIPPDLEGGFMLTVAGRPGASAQTARPAAFLATALRKPELTPPALATAERELHDQTMRFLLQLSVDSSLRWCLRVPERAYGGVRSATWTLDLPVAAQALCLLTAAETLASHESLESLDADP